MKGKITLCLIAVLTALAASQPVRADDKADIQSAYKRFENAVKARNLEAVMAIGTPDFSMKMGGTVMNATQVKSQMKISFDMMKAAPKFTTTINKMSIKKGTAEVDSTGSMSADVVDAQGMFGKKGARHKLTDMQVSRDTWVKTGKGWKMKMTETISEKLTVDGKPFNPMAPPAGGGAPKK